MYPRLTCSILVAFVALGCGSEDGTNTELPYSSDSDADVPLPVSSDAGMASQPTGNGACKGTPTTFRQVTAFDKCVMCHAATRTGPQRSAAPIDINFDSETAAVAHAQRAVYLVMAGAMPPRESGLTLSGAERQQLYDWVMCRM